MKLGMPTLVEYARLEDNLELCRRLGLEFVEINMNLPVCNPEVTGAAELLRLKREYGVELTIHLPEELDLGSIHGAMRQGHVQRCKEAIDWASGAEIEILNLHLNPGVYFTLPDRKIWIYDAHTGQVPVDDRLRLAEKKGFGAVVEVKTSQALEDSIRSVRDRWTSN